MAMTQQYTPEAVIKALRDNDGIKTQAAKALGCVRQTVDVYCERYPEVMRAYLDEKEKLLDVSESKMVQIIKDDTDRRAQASMVKFHLQTIGRDRGYGDQYKSIERMKKALGDVSELNLDAYTNDQLKQLRELIKIGTKSADQIQREAPRSIVSTDMTAKEAIASIRDMKRISDIVKFTKGDKRKTVKRAAKQRKNAIKKETDTDE